MKTKIVSFSVVRRKALLTAMMVSVAVILPQVCHLLGDQLGYGSRLGEMLLPMHLPVMMAGMLWGPWAGLFCGLVSPVASFALTGMPGVALLPFMTVELAVYGLSAGLLRRTNLPSLAQVVLTQVAGRVARAAVLVVAIYGFGFARLPISIVWTSIAAGIAGVAIQWAVLPLVGREGKR